MAAHTQADKVSLLNDGINILNINAVRPSPEQQVCKTIAAILILVRVSTLALCPSMNIERANSDQWLN